MYSNYYRLMVWCTMTITYLFSAATLGRAFVYWWTGDCNSLPMSIIIETPIAMGFSAVLTWLMFWDAPTFIKETDCNT